MNKADSVDSTLIEQLVSQIADEYAERLSAGECPAIEDYEERHPQLAGILRRVLPAVEVMCQLSDGSLGTPVDSSVLPETGRLGDFRIVREVGRGGMGVVYETEQISLNRRVALKVLPFAAVLDDRQLRRFKNEAQAAALLRHPNIVSVHSVGCERGVHYYAMDLVEGHSLAQVIDAMRPAGYIEAGGTQKSEYAGRPREPVDQPAVDDSSCGTKGRHSSLADETTPIVVLSTQHSSHRREFYRSVARLAMQAAEAMDYAHHEGVIHRDIKPSNLMLDKNGKLWITDFGLAQVQGDHNLTMTGDLLGTLRYMSPEQAAGRKLLDERTDVYSLGITLYELLTLQPAFPGGDRQSLLRQIEEAQPLAPRRVDNAIPRDLETVVLKAIEKEPGARYESAAELANDLRRFLEQKPVRARRTGRFYRLWQWSKRNRRLAGLTATVIGLLMLLAVAGPLVAIRQTRLARERTQLARERLLNLYVANINVAARALELGNLERARDLLERHRPRTGDEDLRGFEWYHLRQKCGQSLLAFSLEPERPVWFGGGPVRLVAFPSDGKLLVAGMWSNEVKLWDLREKEIVHRLGVVGELTAVAFPPDGKVFAMGRETNTIELWDIVADRLLQTLEGHSAEIGSVGFSPDAAWLASASIDGEVRLWRKDADTDGGRYVEHDVLMHTAPVHCLAFAPNSRLLTSASDVVHLWNLEAAHEPLRLEGHAGEVRAVAFSRDGAICASGGQDRTVRLWDASTGRPLRPLVGHEDTVVSIAFSCDGRRLASAALDGEVRLWDVPQGVKLAALEAHSGPAWSVAFSPDGTLVASGGQDDAVKLWRAESGEKSYHELTADDQVRDVAFSPLAPLMSSVSWDGTVRVWDLETYQPLHRLPAHDGLGNCVAISPDGRLLASGGGSWKFARQPPHVDFGELKLFDIATGQELANLGSHGVLVTDVAFSPDSRLLASSDVAGTVNLWDVNTAQLLDSQRRPRPVAALAFAPDESLLALGTGRAIELWEVTEGRLELRQTREAHDDAVFYMSFSPSGRTFASAGLDNTARIWDVEGAQLHVLRGHGSWVVSCAFSADGKTLATGSKDNTMKLWNVATGSELLTFKGHRLWVLAVAFSPDGRLLASGAGDRTIRLWHAPWDEYQGKNHVSHPTLRRLPASQAVLIRHLASSVFSMAETAHVGAGCLVSRHCANVLGIDRRRRNPEKSAAYFANY